MRANQIIRIIVIGMVAFGAGCRIYTLDTFYFDPVTIEGDYFQPADIKAEYHIRWIIPDSLRELVMLDVHGNDVYGFFVSAPDTITNPPTVIYSHGNDKNINKFWSWAEVLWECGYNVFIYDFEGYGKSEGEVSDEACFRDMEAAINYCHSRPDVDTTRTIYMGLSMGTYVAVYGATEFYSPAAVILESPPASTKALVKDSYLLDLPAGYFSDATQFDSEARIDQIGCPLFIMAGDDDDYVVFERNGEILYAKAHQPKELWLVNNAKHSDIKDVVGYAEFRSRITQFVSQYLP